MICEEITWETENTCVYPDELAKKLTLCHVKQLKGNTDGLISLFFMAKYSIVCM